MKFNNPFLLVALSLTFFWSCNSAKVEPIPGEGATVFTNVNVVPMTGEEVLNDQTVLVREGKIEK
jgi:hypothetical protein